MDLFYLGSDDLCPFGPEISHNAFVSNRAFFTVFEEVDIPVPKLASTVYQESAYITLLIFIILGIKIKQTTSY